MIVTFLQKTRLILDKANNMRKFLEKYFLLEYLAPLYISACLFLIFIIGNYMFGKHKVSSFYIPAVIESNVYANSTSGRSTFQLFYFKVKDSNGRYEMIIMSDMPNSTKVGDSLQSVYVIKERNNSWNTLIKKYDTVYAGIKYKNVFIKNNLYYE